MADMRTLIDSESDNPTLQLPVVPPYWPESPEALPEHRFAAAIVPLVVLIVFVAGIGAWQIFTTRSQLDSARSQIAQVQIRERRAVSAATSALASAQRTVRRLQYLSATTTTTPCLYVYENSSAQYGCSPVPVLTDTTVLTQAFITAATLLTGSSALLVGQQQAFINQFWAAQAQREGNGAHGEAWLILNPLTRAGAFIQANDPADVTAASMVKWGNIVNCLSVGGVNCTSTAGVTGVIGTAGITGATETTGE